MLICWHSDRSIPKWTSLALVSLLVILSLSEWPVQVLSKTSKQKQAPSRKSIKCGANKPFRGTRVKGRVGKGEFPFLADIMARDNIGYDDAAIASKGTVNNDLAVMLNEQPPRSRTFNCSGAIISRRRILTSMKCVTSFNPGNQDIDIEYLSKNPLRFPNITYEIKLGSTKHMYGRPMSTKGCKISTKEYPMMDSVNNKSTRDKHGLAIIKLRKRINYSLKFVPSNGGKMVNGSMMGATKNPRTSYSINRVCFSQNERFPDERLVKDSLYAPSWYTGHKRAKVLQMNLVPCPNGISNLTAICVSSRTKRFGPLQEGAPLVRYKGKMRWELVGIRSGLSQSEQRQISECPNHKCRSSSKSNSNKIEIFIPLHADLTRQWLMDELYRQKLVRS